MPGRICKGPDLFTAKPLCGGKFRARIQTKTGRGAAVDETEGPGLTPSQRRWEPVSTTSIVFAVLGLTPRAAFGSTLGVEALGPIAFPALFAIVGVLFGLLAIIRHGELQHPLALRVGIIGLSLGLLRLFIYPLAGW